VESLHPTPGFPQHGLLVIEVTKVKEDFQIIVSLGGLCQVAYQIERRFGYKFNSPFDWIVTPMESIEKILSTDGSEFGRSIKVINNGSTAICRSYGVAYHHDYKRDENGYIIIDSDSILASRSKMINKYEKFKEMLASKPRTLFIRFCGHHDSAISSSHLIDDRTVETRDLNALCKAIEGKFGGLVFEFAFVYKKECTEVKIDHTNLDHRVRVFSLADDPTDTWTGNDASWDTIFNYFSYNLIESSNTGSNFFISYNSEHLHA
jgi:hypothetical protein